MHNVLEGIIARHSRGTAVYEGLAHDGHCGLRHPAGLLFAFIALHLCGMSANLLSMGAIDFGIIIDGAVVMVEALFVTLSAQARSIGMEAFNRRSHLGMIRQTARGKAKSVFFSKLIIITALMPIFTFQKVEGKMFSPLAYTLGFALLGALLFTLTLVPVLSSMLLKKNVKEKKNRFLSLVYLCRQRLRLLPSPQQQGHCPWHW
jgi:cobalt-zinc-cadmium resistance protein CzcA